MTNNFTVILSNRKNQIKLEYELADNKIARMWFNKCMKHLKRVDPDLLWAGDIRKDIKESFKDFIDLTNVTPIDLTDVNQDTLNQLHHILIDNYEKISHTKKGRDVIMFFHNAIHHQEDINNAVDIAEMKRLRICYGQKGDLLITKNFLLNRYMDRVMEKNCIYLLPVEPGKSPYIFFKDNEEITDQNIEKIMCATITFRPDWYINIKKIIPKKFSNEYLIFFDKIKDRFFKKHEKYGLDQWPEHYEYGSVRLANPLHNHDTLQLFQEGYRYHSVLID